MAPYKRSSLISQYRQRRAIAGRAGASATMSEALRPAPAARESQVMAGLLQAVPLAACLWLGLAGLVTLIL